jgi:septal ring factor EnvC (AmiA/AmiB activator)
MPKFLPILNAAGCLMLAGLAVVQWRKERTLDGRLHAVRVELGEARTAHRAEERRAAALERDIAMLKESLESTQKAAEQGARDLAEQGVEAEALRAELEAARVQVEEWREALAARDARIEELDAALAAARKRLEEAIARLKGGGGGN